ncbi:beta-ketoacyl-(acyl carrier protein) synthase II [Candidatus Methylacidithermus pantelleriae]|uniref:3-oxoacyl-[acyl-carrier-protein] synthase 2 n=2 Tax=Candidatus Methylacidithermus pantelleriae TaxID=2744239 RepID=A0A8J2FRH9_9BACT|nr:beta-ketoacyl-(acyl carrier protein) synthase II [Candidatus Methylacidithermus pantelleriae]
MGVVAPNGNCVKEFWANVLAGRSGIAPVRSFDASRFDSQIAGEIKNFDPYPFFRNSKDVRRTDRFVHLAMAAAYEAVRQAGLDRPGEVDATRAGVIVGSGIGGLKTLEEQHSLLETKGPTRVSPFMIPRMINNMASGLIAIEFGFQGPNFAVISACATAAHCVGESWRLIREGEADVMVAGGSEAAVTPLGLSGFGMMRALSVRNHEPEKASRPFDRDRDGFVLSEGGAILVLEELEHALHRGVPILAEILGYGLSADAYHMTAPGPGGKGAARAMQKALEKAHLPPESVDYINAHGTGTPDGDRCETQAIKEVFGRHAYRVPISSTKSMTGHMLAAAGAAELVVCIEAIRSGVIPPTINLDHPDPECDLDYVPHKAREWPVRIAMNNSFGFGGHNACLVVGSWH